jgi:hypothetical protein
MQPKNKPERTKAFINFLLLFLLSIVIIVTTVFFSTDVPVKQSNDLRRQLHEVEKERVIAAHFLTKMSEIGEMVDSVNNSRDPDFIDTKIKEKISYLQVKADNDTVYHQRLYQSVVKNMYDLWKAKKQLRESNGFSDKVTQLENEKAAVQQKLDKVTDQYNELYRQCVGHK